MSSDEIKNESFHSDVDKIFESYLKEDDSPKIMVKDVKNNRLISNMNYSKVLFDADLNIYKVKSDGTIERVENSNFSAVVVKA